MLFDSKTDGVTIQTYLLWDDDRTMVINYYMELEWASENIVVGFEHGSDDSLFYEHEYSQTFDTLLLAHDSNCGRSGWWAYEVLDDEIQDGDASGPSKDSVHQ